MARATLYLVTALSLCAGFAAGAAPWSGEKFNYQLGELFSPGTHVIPGVKVYFIDGFDTPAATVSTMIAQGLLPVCYFR
jgi:hypothetical protein